jgi:hypothetical protein
MKKPPMTVFDVAKVEPATKPLKTVSSLQAIEQLLRNYHSIRDIEACSQHKATLLADVDIHPLVAAIYYAFCNHHPLCLSPDMIWLLITQGFASHVNANAEKLRPQFVKHQGKATIQICRNDFVKGSPDNPWPEVFGEFSSQIREHIGEDIHDLLVPTFSTTGAIEKAACEIVLMDAMQPYFEYEMLTICGIPKIKLEGTLADWQALLDRTQKLAQFDLHLWVNNLTPVLEQFVAAVKGNPDPLFWQSVYVDIKNDGYSTTTYITGWINYFFPYYQDKDTGEYLFCNWKRKNIEISEFPSGLAIAPFRWQYLQSFYEMDFLGGFVGITQDPNDLCLRPEIGWAVCDRGMDSRDEIELYKASKEGNQHDVGSIIFDEDEDEDEANDDDVEYGKKNNKLSKLSGVRLYLLSILMINALSVSFLESGTKDVVFLVNILLSGILATVAIKKL